jgi:hypothetical protein
MMDCIPLSQYQDCRTLWQMEKVGVSLLQLLVASNVQIHWQVCFHL